MARSEFTERKHWGEGVIRYSPARKAIVDKSCRGVVLTPWQQSLNRFLPTPEREIAKFPVIRLKLRKTSTYDGLSVGDCVTVFECSHPLDRRFSASGVVSSIRCIRSCVYVEIELITPEKRRIGENMVTSRIVRLA